jgi:hypothetical protein
LPRELLVGIPGTRGPDACGPTAHQQRNAEDLGDFRVGGTLPGRGAGVIGDAAIAFLDDGDRASATSSLVRAGTSQSAIAAWWSAPKPFHASGAARLSARVGSFSASMTSV